MPWIQFGGAVLGFLGSRGARKREKEAQRQQMAIAQEQLGLSRRQVEMGERTYNDWYNTFFPMAGEMVSEARREVRPDFERIAGDVRGQYEGERGAMIRSAQRYGINPQDGAFSTSLARLGSDEAKTHVLARNRARQDSQGQRLRNMATVYGMGSGMPGLAAQQMQGAGSGMANAGAAYGGAAASAGADAANTAYGISNLAGSIPWGNFMRKGGGTANTVPGQAGAGYTVPNYGSSAGPWSSGYSYPSSRELKYGIEKINPEDALDVVMRTPVRGYKYKGDTQPFVGTIAEDAPAEISDGKRVNLVNQVGVLTGAVQSLTQRINKSPNQAKPIRYGMAKPVREPADDVAFDDVPRGRGGQARFMTRRFGMGAMA